MPQPSHSDVLVVGAGSAGSTVAERLSVDDRCRVTVLETGPGPGTAGVRALIRDGRRLPLGAGSPVVARYATTLTEHPIRGAELVRGATVGGSGAVNGGYFCRAVPADVRRWALPGWAWADVLEHFRAIETDLDFPHSPEHGDRGPIPIRRNGEFTGGTADFVDAALRAGFGWLDDLNAAGSALPTGIGAVPSNIVDGVRVGPGAVLLDAAASRPNLTVLPGTRAHRIVIADGRATGVHAHGPTGQLSLSADRIVISAGAIGSAQLLMVSGVGDEAVLRAAGIPVLQPAPVGRRCSDHPEWVLPVDRPGSPGRAVLEVVLSLAEGIEIRPYSYGFAAMVGDSAPVLADRPHLGVALMNPRSRGRITVVSPDSAVPPRIEHRYDSDAADLADLARGTELARELAAGADVGAPAWSTSQHLCGSAPMGADGDELAVVDPRCRVRGVAGLWVIDGSVLPAVPSRGPHATTVMLGHRAAAFVAAG